VASPLYSLRQDLPMINYITLEEQVDADFTRARRKALLRRIKARLRNDLPSASMLPFEEVRKKLGAQDRGLRLGRGLCGSNR
jgi:hypothetical protein